MGVFYRYTPDRKGEHPRQHLRGFKGILQADGYAGFARLYGNAIIEAACMAHARRKIFDVFETTKSPLAKTALEKIAALYRIEAEIRGRPPDERLRARTDRSAPLFADLKAWLEVTLRRVSGRSEMAKAIRYSLSRWNALTTVLRDGRACIDNSAAERCIRPVATPVSLCTSLLSIWKHWKLVTGGEVTRAPFTPGRLHHRRRIQVRGTDLERGARNNLLGAKDTGADQLANPMAGHAASFRRLAQGQPFTVFLSGPVGANATDTPDRTDPMGRPGLVLAGWQSHPVQRGRDILVGPTGSHAPDDRQGVVGGAARVFARAGLAKTQFGVLSALPMNDQDDLAPRFVDIDDDIVDQGTHQLLAAAHADVGVLPGRFEVLGDRVQVRHRRIRRTDCRLLKTFLTVSDAS
jgi:hypothetical protein